MNQVLSREEVAALIQGLAEAVTERRELDLPPPEAPGPGEPVAAKRQKFARRQPPVGLTSMRAGRDGLKSVKA